MLNLVEVPDYDPVENIEWGVQYEGDNDLSQEMFWDESASFLPRYEDEDEIYISDNEIESIWGGSQTEKEEIFFSDSEDLDEASLGQSFQSLREALNRSTENNYYTTWPKKEWGSPDRPQCNGPPLEESNKGYKLLTEMGWSKGQGLGRKGEGVKSPIGHNGQNSKAGLGKDKRKVNHQVLQLGDLEAPLQTIKSKINSNPNLDILVRLVEEDEKKDMDNWDSGVGSLDSTVNSIKQMDLEAKKGERE